MKALHLAMKALVERGGSDLHFKAHVPIYFRCRDELLRQDLPRPSAGDLEDALKEILKPEELAAFRRGEEVRATYPAPDGHRFRVSVLTQRGSVGLVLRHMPERVPGFDELHLPEVVRNFPRLKRGLVLITGPARAGKSTTLAAVLQAYADGTERRVITLEDPVEYRIRSSRALVTQRQVGVDTESFGTGLRAARRQDPDVVVFSSLPDAETLFSALALAGSGVITYLVLSASSAVKALERLTGLFPTSRRDQVMTRLSIALRAVYYQELIESTEPGVRLPAFELLVPDPEVRQRIKAGHLHGTEELLDRLRGCFSLSSSIRKLAQDGKVSREVAVRRLQAMARPGKG